MLPLAAADPTEVEAQRREAGAVQLAIGVKDDGIVEGAAVQRVRMSDDGGGAGGTGDA